MRGRVAWGALALGALGGGAAAFGGTPEAVAPLLLVGFAVFALATPRSLNVQILIGAVLAFALGAASFRIDAPLGIEHIDPVGDAFIAALKMLVAPMILLAITHGIGRLGEARSLGRLGLATLGLYAVTMAFAVVTGLVFVNVFEPGAGGLADSPEWLAAVGEARAGAAADRSFADFLDTAIQSLLTNPVASIARGEVLPIVFFAVLFGVALVQLGAPGRPLVDVLGHAYQAVMRILGWIIRLTPIGIFALIASLVAATGASDLLSGLGHFAAVVVGATLLHALVTLPLVAWVLAGVRPVELLVSLREALAVAFTTSSSVATLPVTTRCAERNLGVPRTVSSLVLPLGATMNMDGTALYEAVAAIFIANAYGVELGLSGQLVVFAMAMLMAVGAPGIPSAGMVTMVVVLEAVGLPVEAVAVLISIDRFLDTIRTMTNVEGDAVVAVCVAARVPEAPP